MSCHLSVTAKGAVKCTIDVYWLEGANNFASDAVGIVPADYIPFKLLMARKIALYKRQTHSSPAVPVDRPRTEICKSVGLSYREEGVTIRQCEQTTATVNVKQHAEGLLCRT